MAVTAFKLVFPVVRIFVPVKVELVAEKLPVVVSTEPGVWVRVLLFKVILPPTVMAAAPVKVVEIRFKFPPILNVRPVPAIVAVDIVRSEELAKVELLGRLIVPF